MYQHKRRLTYTQVAIEIMRSLGRDVYHSSELLSIAQRDYEDTFDTRTPANSFTSNGLNNKSKKYSRIISPLGDGWYSLSEWNISSDEAERLIALQEQNHKQPPRSSTGETVQQNHPLRNEGYFDPNIDLDLREWAIREIALREGQSEFRKALIAAYNGICAVTGCRDIAALEAAHIHRFLGPHSNHVQNGLLLRADIHLLFDKDLIRIDPETRRVRIHGSISGGGYLAFHNVRLREPSNPAERPHKEYLTLRWTGDPADYSDGP